MKPIAIFAERWGPLALALFGVLSFGKWGEQFYSVAEESNLSVSSLYQAVFDTSSIVCAFLFSFLIFIKTTENHFLSAFRSKKIYKRMERHFIYSITASFVLTIMTIPVLVISPMPDSMYTWSFLYVAIWIAVGLGWVVSAVYDRRFCRC